MGEWEVVFISLFTVVSTHPTLSGLLSSIQCQYSLSLKYIYIYIFILGTLTRTQWHFKVILMFISLMAKDA